MIQVTQASNCLPWWTEGLLTCVEEMSVLHLAVVGQPVGRTEGDHDREEGHHEHTRPPRVRGGLKGLVRTHNVRDIVEIFSTTTHCTSHSRVVLTSLVAFTDARDLQVAQIPAQLFYASLLIKTKQFSH